ncbi:MAG: FadR/GntR family transcriptional regulator [Thiolinea sp.]
MVEKRTRKLGSGDIAGILRREINKGNLAPKDRLPAERTLAETYGVARGTIREALNQLESEGLVEVRPGSGTYVLGDQQEQLHSAIEHARPLELIDARFALEPHMCRLAVLHANKKDLERAEELLKTMEASTNDPIAFSIADTKFHTFLAEVTGNSLLIWMVSQINSVRNQEEWAHMRNTTLNEDSIAEYNRQHRAILDAIRAREPERAATLMKNHLEGARLSLTRSVSN